MEKKRNVASLLSELERTNQQIRSLAPIVKQREYGLPGIENKAERKEIHAAFNSALRKKVELTDLLNQTNAHARLRKRIVRPRLRK